MKYNVALYNKKIITSQNLEINKKDSFICINCGEELFFDGIFFVHRNVCYNYIKEETLIKIIIYILNKNKRILLPKLNIESLDFDSNSYFNFLSLQIKEKKTLLFRHIILNSHKGTPINLYFTVLENEQIDTDKKSSQVLINLFDLYKKINSNEYLDYFEIETHIVHTAIGKTWINNLTKNKIEFLRSISSPYIKKSPPKLKDIFKNVIIPSYNHRVFICIRCMEKVNKNELHEFNNITLLGICSKCYNIEMKLINQPYDKELLEGK